MKFAVRLKKKMIPEWQDAYIKYKLLKSLLKPFKITSNLYAKFHENRIKDHDAVLFDDMPEENKEDIDELTKFEKKFKDLLHSEVDKFNAFFHLKIIQLSQEWKIIKINCSLYKPHKLDTNYDLKGRELKNCIFIFFRKIHFLMEYLNMNFEGVRKILKKHKKICKPFKQRIDIFDPKCPELFKNTYIDKHSNMLLKMRDEVKIYFLDIFFHTFNKNNGHKELKDLTQTRIISVWESHFYFFFLGVSISLIGVLIVMGLEGEINPDDNETFKYIFPMYRGAAFIVLYMWMLAWNVYGWTRYHINYRRVFKFNYHFSTAKEILKRATFFSTILLLTFIWYVILNEEVQTISDYINLEKSFVPLFIWGFFICYFFCPFKIFNYEGRKYFFKLMIRIFCLSFCVLDFTMGWATDQMVSFVTPIKDLEYTFCYYIARMNDYNDIHPNQCYQNTFMIGFMAAFIPVFYRMVQCTRSLLNKKKLFDPDLLNFFKYLFTLLVAIFSFLLGKYPNNTLFLSLWIGFAFISTCYSYTWDLKMDWGLIQKNSKHPYLRDKLIYPRINFYYIAIVVNLFLRLAWVLTISPGFVKTIMRPELFTLIIGSLEMFRRSMWNFLRVEKEFILNSDNYQAFEPYTLPFQTEKEYKLSMDSTMKLRSLMKKVGTFERSDVEQEFIKNLGAKSSSDLKFPLLPEKISMGSSFGDDENKRKEKKQNNLSVNNLEKAESVPGNLEKKDTHESEEYLFKEEHNEIINIAKSESEGYKNRVNESPGISQLGKEADDDELLENLKNQLDEIKEYLEEFKNLKNEIDFYESNVISRYDEYGKIKPREANESGNASFRVFSEWVAKKINRSTISKSPDIFENN